MEEKPSAKRQHGETSDQSSNLDDVHVPGEKLDYTTTLEKVDLHGKERWRPMRLKELLKKEKLYTFVGFSIKDDKEMLKKSGLEINPNNFIDIQRNGRVPNTRKEYDTLADVAASIIHPFYRGMKKKIDRKKDHKLWGINPLPDYLIEYTMIVAYATYQLRKKINNIKIGLEIPKEQEEDPCYHCHYAG
ncbi:hypothetical protein VPH35_090109 [Triticum aestivum]